MPKDAPTPDSPKELSSSEATDWMNQLYTQLYYSQSQNIDLVNAEIYLFGREEYYTHGDYDPGIEFMISNQFIRNFNFLRNHAPTEDTPILIHLKSAGGYWTEGMAMYDTIVMSPNPTIILNYTHAESMSSVIFLAGDKRVMMPSSYFMVHRGFMGASGTGTQFETAYKEWKKTEEQMFNIYVEHLKKHGPMTKKSRKSIRKWLEERMREDEDVYFTADEAVEMGFATEVFDGDWERLRKL